MAPLLSDGKQALSSALPPVSARDGGQHRRDGTTHNPRRTSVTTPTPRARPTEVPAPVARSAAAVRYDAFLAACPSRQLLDRISDKWVTLVLCALVGDATRRDATDGGPDDVSDDEAGLGGPRRLRYSELSRLLAGVSQKMLTQTLRSLEHDGLLTRTATPTVPVTVTYELTELGLSLHRVVRHLRGWAEANMDAVAASRAARTASGA